MLLLEMVLLALILMAGQLLQIVVEGFLYGLAAIAVIVFVVSLTGILFTIFEYLRGDGNGH